MDEDKLTIGEVAQRAGLNTSAIRYYERSGVLPEPARESGQRRYDEDTVRQLQVIGVAKRAGFSLRDAQTLLAAESGGDAGYPQLRELAARRLPDVEAQIVRAQAMREWLEAATDCSCATLDVCALFDDRPRARTERGSQCGGWDSNPHALSGNGF